MNYIGGFEKDSTLLLELLTIDGENQPIIADSQPTAIIEHDSGNGLEVVANVTLEAMEDGYTHTISYEIPSDWSIGDYIVTYTVIMNGITETLQEYFSILEPKPLDEDEEVVLPVGDDFSEPATIAKGYIMPFDFQSTSTLEVVGNKVVVTLANSFKYNHTYTLVLDKSIQSKSGQTLGETKTITFHSEFKPLLATPLEVHSIIKSLFQYFTMKDIYVAIRDAGQKAFQYLGRTVDADNTRYREYTERETTYFETTKYVAYESSRSLVSSILIRILNGEEVDSLTDPVLTEVLGGSINLGDFSIGNEDSSGTGNNLSNEAVVSRLKAVLSEVEKELKFWQDAMLGNNRRGYAKPQSASYRSDSGSPEGRDFG